MDEPKTDFQNQHQPLSGVDDIAAAVASDSARNTSQKPLAASGPVEKPSTDIPPKFAKYPKALFVLDDQGRPIFKDGKPVYKNPKGGRPRKAKPGEELLDGTKATGKSKPNPSPVESRIVDPAERQSVEPTPGPAATPTAPPDGRSVELGEDAGDVLADMALNAAESAVKVPPTSNERSSIKRAASATCRGVRMPAWIALVLFTAGYLMRAYAQAALTRAEKVKQAGKTATDSGGAASGASGASGGGGDTSRPFAFGS